LREGFVEDAIIKVGQQNKLKYLFLEKNTFLVSFETRKNIPFSNSILYGKRK